MKDTTIYGQKTLQDLLHDVDSLAVDRRVRIIALIDSLRGFMRSPEEAALFAPMIKDYFDVWIKNDEQLIKVGTIVQRIISADAYQGGGTGGIGDFLTDEEKKKLMSEAVAEIKSDATAVEDSLSILESSTAVALSTTVK